MTRRPYLLLFSSLLLFGAQPEPYRLVDNVLLTKKNAYILQPPETVSNADVQDVHFAPDGRAIAYLRQNYPTDTAGLRQMLLGEGTARKQLAVYSMATRRETVLIPSFPSDAEIVSMDFVPGSESVILRVEHAGTGGATSARQTLALLSPGAAPLTLSEEAEEIGVAVSTTRPIGVVSRMLEDGRIQGRPIGARGWLGAPYTLPEGFVQLSWSGDGKTFLSLRPRQDRTYGADQFSVDPLTGAVRPLQHEVDTQRPEVEDLEIQETVVPFTARDVKERTGILILRSRDAESDAVASRVTVTSDGRFEGAPVSMSAIAYRTRGLLVVRRLLKMPRANFEDAFITALRKVAEEEAKQVGLALMMYSNDYDEEWPDADNLVEKVYPYIKNRGPLERFVYTFGGGPMEDPSKTRIGYYPARGGNVILYGDGSSHWEPSR